METKNKFLILLITITSIVFCASGEFTGWGDKILHHVADSDPQSIYTINSEKFVDTNNNDKWDNEEPFTDNNHGDNISKKECKNLDGSFTLIPDSTVYLLGFIKQNKSNG